MILLAISNREEVLLLLHPLEGGITLPLFLPLLACFLIGLIAGGFAESLHSWRLRHALYQKNKRLNALENEIEGVRMGRTQHLRINTTVE